MREMNPVIAGGVIPSAMYIHKSAMIRQRKMSIRLIKKSTRALSLEIENNIRKRIALQNIVIDFKRT